MIEQYSRMQQCGVMMKHPNGSIEIYMIPLQESNLSNGCNSYQIIGVSELHDNEFKNLTDKLDKACINLKKHFTASENTSMNGVWIHMHEGSAMDKCREHIAAYLNQITDNQISFVWLYKPSLTRTQGGKNMTWSHVHMEIFDASHKNKWNDAGGKFPKFTVLYGDVFESSDIQQTLLANDVEIALTDKYIYQKGNIYVDATILPSGEVRSDLSHPTPGVHVHGVIRNTLNMKDGEKLVLSPKFAKDEKLTIL